MVEPGRSSDVEYRFLKFRTHDEAERALNQEVADGWQLVTYQAAGGDTTIMHFLLLSRSSRKAERRMGFGS
jgi:hypothetical protein